LLRLLAFQTVDGAPQPSEHSATLSVHECPPDAHELRTVPFGGAKGAPRVESQQEVDLHVSPEVRPRRSLLQFVAGEAEFANAD